MITIDTESSVRGLNMIRLRLDAVDKAIVDVAISTLEKCGEIIERMNEEIHDNETFIEDGWGYDKNDEQKMMAGDVVKRELKTLCKIAYGEDAGRDEK